MYERNAIFVDGPWMPSESDERFEVICASTGEIIGRVPAGTVEEADRAVAAASRALPGWSDTSREDRAHLLE